ncbi:lasso peptide biosynthesis PqqD family chaperone [Streptomyces phytohabitans]|uniref:lasso peptide biosynthesis PqqD family chaperone n=1 Tax=Streptomyces phytohabitans TaxID=1150371 RepID=UPI00345C1B7A
MPLSLRPDVSLAETEDGTVLLQLRTGRYWQLNGTGTYVLRLLTQGYEPARVAAELAARHGIDGARALRDVEDVVARLRAASLLEPAP